MNQPSQTVTGSSEQKHTLLDNAISSINRILVQVNDISSRVTGGDCSAKVSELKETHPNTCLFEVLNEGSHRINDKCSEIHKALSDLENTLF